MKEELDFVVRDEESLSVDLIEAQYSF